MQPLYQAFRKQPILSAYGIFCFFDIGLFWLTVSAGQEVMTAYAFFCADPRRAGADGRALVPGGAQARQSRPALGRWCCCSGRGTACLWFFTLNAANALLAGTFTPAAAAGLPLRRVRGGVGGWRWGLMARSLKKTK